MNDNHLALIHIVNFVLKEQDAPCSAQSHLDYAIALLSKECPKDWNPQDTDVVRVINDAREHIAFYYEWAKEPWPSISNVPVVNGRL